MSQSPYIVEVDSSNFAEVVLQGSVERPVVVDFWADWCNPCQMLMPILARLADEYQGQFLLAKVNTDANQDLAMQYGVRSLPTVKLFRNGQPVDEFMGALPESAVREFLDRHIERESTRLHAEALVAQHQGDLATARRLLEEAHAMEPRNGEITADLAAVLAEDGEFEKAESLLNALPPDERGKPKPAGMLARLEFARQARELPSDAELEEKLRDDPDNLDLRYQFAISRLALGDYDTAVEQLLAIMAKDRSYKDDAARKTLLKVFDLLGDDPRVDQYRRRMFNLMY